PSVDAELGPAPAGHPHAVAVPAPGAPLLAGRAGQLPHHAGAVLDGDAAEAPGAALGLAQQVARTGREAGLAVADLELALAAARHPHLVAAHAPALAAPARPGRQLVQQAHR